MDGGSYLKLLTTAEVADAIGFSEEWVREHAAELGGRRVGNGRRSALRFDAAGIDRWWRTRTAEPQDITEKPQRPGPRRSPSGVELLPLPAAH